MGIGQNGDCILIVRNNWLLGYGELSTITFLLVLESNDF